MPLYAGGVMRVPSQSTYSARVIALGTEYTPSMTRPTLVIIAPYITCDKNEAGRIRVLVGNAGSSSFVADLELNFDDADAVNAKNVYATFPITFIVPAGKVYICTSSTLQGTPTYLLGDALELTL